MSTLKSIWDCMFSPRLIQIYYSNYVPLRPAELYRPTAYELFGDHVIHSLYVIWRIGVYTSPFLVGILYQKGYLTHESLPILTKFVTSIGVILIASYCCRAIGRSRNEDYQEFLNTLRRAKTNLTPEVKRELNKYDFDFRSWPVEFSVESKRKTPRTTIAESSSQTSLIEYVGSIPFRIIAYLAIHTFGIRLIYPGSLGFLQAILDQGLLQGRARLVERFHGVRYKLQTADKNEIDTMYVDNPDKQSRGSTLVICCEGNAGFYEIGIMITALEAGYSVLGWNHPGFAGSTGKPYPPQEQNAVDAVMQFAINRLNYRPENILIFGWSIGGYTSTWAAMNYPDVKGIILDATFDDILPLATTHMPSWWSPIVKLAVRQHVNLNIFEQLKEYPGPVLLIRRTDDEVICLREGDLSSNRGNNLLLELLKYRYPLIFNVEQIQLLKDYLAVSTSLQEILVQRIGVNENVCYSLLQSYISEYSKSYPMKIGEDFSIEDKNRMTLYLAKKYMKDFKSTHCINLPAEMLQPPWDVAVESDYVFT